MSIDVSHSIGKLFLDETTKETECSKVKRPSYKARKNPSGNKAEQLLYENRISLTI